MAIAHLKKAETSQTLLPSTSTGMQKLEESWDIAKRTALFTTSPSTQDLIDALDNGNTLLIEDTALKRGLKGFEAAPGDLALSLTTLTAYIIDIVAVVDHFLLHKTFINPPLCEQILTSMHEVVTNAILWSNLEVDSPPDRKKSLNFGDSIKQQLKNKTLARRLLKINLHLKARWVDVVVISSGKGFDWQKTVSGISDDCQGLAIIHSFADEVITRSDGKILRLRFYI